MNPPPGPRSRPARRRFLGLLAALGITAGTIVGLAVGSSPVGAATCNPLGRLLGGCTTTTANTAAAATANCAGLQRLLGLCTPAPPPPTTPGYISMEQGLPPDITGPDPCTALLHALRQCVPTHLDPAYAPALAIPHEPSGDTPTTPADPAAPCGGQTPTKPDGSAWACTFADEFSGDHLDPSKWSPQLTSQTGFTTGSGAAVACYVSTPDTVSVSGGALSLTVRRTATPSVCARNGTNPPFTTQFEAGGVSTMGHFSQAYGRFDVRAAFPASVQQGLQSSLWLWPDDPFKYGPWPGSGEIDTAEYYTNRPGFVVPTLHYNANPSVNDRAKGFNTTTNSFCHFDQPGLFHDYTLIWTPDILSVYYDGTLCMFDHWTPQNTTAPAPFDSPFFQTLTAGLGIGDNAVDPATTELPATTRVDYVRVWR